MILKLTPRALTDIEKILIYIEKESPQASRMVARRIEKSLSLLTEMPKLGRLGIRSETRELAVSRLPFSIVYRLKNESVEVITVFHTARNPDDKNI